MNRAINQIYIYTQNPSTVKFHIKNLLFLLFSMILDCLYNLVVTNFRKMYFRNFVENMLLKIEMVFSNKICVL